MINRFQRHEFLCPFSEKSAFAANSFEADGFCYETAMKGVVMREVDLFDPVAWSCANAVIDMLRGIEL